MDDERTTAPLAGLRVLDLSQMLAGPLCAMRLGDLGADVVKVEPPGTGEWTRSHGFANAAIMGETTALLGLNRNKRSAAIDLKSEQGRALFRELAHHADVVVQNFRVGTAERLGVGYEELHELNPRLVYCQISGYGEDGPYRDRPGQDLLVQGYSGAMWSVGAQGDGPAASPVWAADAMTAYQACIGILAALRERETSDLGQKVSIDMWSVMLDCQSQELVTYLNTGALPQRSAEPFAHVWCNPPYGAFQTADGYVLLSQVPIDQLGEALDDDVLREISDWQEAHSRRDEIRRRVAAVTPTKTTEEWLRIFDSKRLWSAPVYTYADIEVDPHVAARKMIIDVDHPLIGRLRMPAPPIRLSRSEVSVRKAPPLLGADTDEVVEEWLGTEPKSSITSTRQGNE